MPHLLRNDIEDSRELSAKFRRVELQQILKQEKLWDDEKHAALPKDSIKGLNLLDVVKLNNVDLTKYIDHDGSFTVTGRNVHDVRNKKEASLERQIAELQDQIKALQAKK